MTAPMTAAEVFETANATANATAKKAFDKADILISAGAQAKIISRFFEKFGVNTPEDKALKMSVDKIYHNAQKEYIKLFADDDDEEAKIDAQVDFYELTEGNVESVYKICRIFRKHKLPMYEKRLCDE